MDKFVLWAVTFVVGFFCSIYQAFVAGFLWVWFITPIFGIAAPSLWLLIGLAIFVRLFTHQTPPMREDEPNAIANTLYAVVYSLIYTTSAFFGGWIFHLFV